MRKRSINIKKDEVSGYLVENVTDPEFLRSFSKVNLIRRVVPAAQENASANELCSPGMCRARMSKSCRAERNHSSLKQRCMNGSLVEPEFMTMTAASLSHEMMNR